MRYMHLVLAGLFGLSALLQYNDPDPVAWALVYLAGAGLAVATFRGLRVRSLALVLAAVCLVWMASLAPGMTAFLERGDLGLLTATMKAGDPMIEEAREFLGLGLVLVYSIAASFKRPART